VRLRRYGVARLPNLVPSQPSTVLMGRPLDRNFDCGMKSIGL
jgi:hypothetical protein